MVWRITVIVAKYTFVVSTVKTQATNEPDTLKEHLSFYAVSDEYQNRNDSFLFMDLRPPILTVGNQPPAV